jgi:nucleoside-diphosphate-sugar epimerase
MRVLITGAGLIGCYTTKELIDRGDEVTFFDLQPSLPYLQKVLGKELPLIRGDIRELPALIEAMQNTRAEVVIHTAELQGNRAPYFGFQVNLIGTLNVAEAVRLTGVRRLIHASSQGVYDLTDPPIPIHEEARRDGGARRSADGLRRDLQV